jgi:hypothetical protein
VPKIQHNVIVTELLRLLATGRTIDEIHPDQKFNAKERLVTFNMADGHDVPVTIHVENNADFIRRWGEVSRFWKSIVDIKLGDAKEG